MVDCRRIILGRLYDKTMQLYLSYWHVCVLIIQASEDHPFLHLYVDPLRASFFIQRPTRVFFYLIFALDSICTLVRFGLWTAKKRTFRVFVVLGFVLTACLLSDFANKPLSLATALKVCAPYLQNMEVEVKDGYRTSIYIASYRPSQRHCSILGCPTKTLTAVAKLPIL